MNIPIWAVVLIAVVAVVLVATVLVAVCCMRRNAANNAAVREYYQTQRPAGFDATVQGEIGRRRAEHRAQISQTKQRIVLDRFHRLQYSGPPTVVAQPVAAPAAAQSPQNAGHKSPAEAQEHEQRMFYDAAPRPQGQPGAPAPHDIDAFLAQSRKAVDEMHRRNEDGVRRRRRDREEWRRQEAVAPRRAKPRYTVVYDLPPPDVPPAERQDGNNVFASGLAAKQGHEGPNELRRQPSLAAQSVVSTCTTTSQRSALFDELKPTRLQEHLRREHSSRQRRVGHAIYSAPFQERPFNRSDSGLAGVVTQSTNISHVYQEDMEQSRTSANVSYVSFLRDDD